MLWVDCASGANPRVVRSGPGEDCWGSGSSLVSSPELAQLMEYVSAHSMCTSANGSACREGGLAVRLAEVALFPLPPPARRCLLSTACWLSPGGVRLGGGGGSPLISAVFLYYPGPPLGQVYFCDFSDSPVGLSSFHR